MVCDVRDNPPLPVYRSVAQIQTSDKQKTYPNPFGFEYELFGGELGTRTPDPLRVMHDDFLTFIT